MHHYGVIPWLGYAKIYTFGAIKDNVWNRVNNLKNMFLTHVGMEVLLKAMIQAIPTYAMSVFLLFRKQCNGIASIMSRFWKGDHQNDTKIQ